MLGQELLPTGVRLGQGISPVEDTTRICKVVLGQELVCPLASPGDRRPGPHEAAKRRLVDKGAPSEL